MQVTDRNRCFVTPDSGDATWPGLDSWQMAGAYLFLDRTRLVLDYFEFVRRLNSMKFRALFAASWFLGTERAALRTLIALASPMNPSAVAAPSATS